MKEQCRDRKKRLTHRVHVRLTEEKYRELSELLARSRGARSLSQLTRNVLEGRPIIVKTYDASLDRVMEELAAARRDIRAIGRNINKVTARMQREQLPGAALADLLRLVDLQQQADLKVTLLMEITAKLSERWLPK